MIAWINFLVLVLSSILFLYFYILSVSPAQLEKKIGDTAYPRCMRLRIIAGAFESVTVINYIVYFFYPLPLGLPIAFPWEYWISLLLAILIAVPSGYVMYIGLKDAGREALEPRKEHTLYGGIYERMRHPQALGEAFLWFPIALILNSPFLVLFSFVYIPILYIMCLAEEKDLVIRYGQSYVDYRNRVGFFRPRRTSQES
jgi:protein-S-isoprenylcysteine O-methyltransferase Ste14